jgi:hypothetical protein
MRQRGLDSSHDGVEIVDDILASHAKNANAKAHEDAIALPIAGSSGLVDTAVDLHHEAALRAVEIRDEPLDDELPSKGDPHTLPS